jgi:quinoprotein glucose dehydrogenase
MAHSRLLPGRRSVLTFLTAAALLVPHSRAAADDEIVSPGATLAAATMQVADGYSATAVASEPLLSNPVAFCFDPRGRIFVAETHRIKRGTEDNRDHMDWLDDDLAARTVEQRRAYMTRHMGDRVGKYTTASEVVRLLADGDGDGVYETSHVFSDDYKDLVDGAAAGVMWMGDRLWFTCIPSLYELRDPDGDGENAEKRVLHTGFGIHVALFGHDLHGLCEGPDGRIYFSIGDRGLHVKTPSGALINADSGSVLRCRRDGSELELFATSLRNPQELAFNEFGDLFTVDNNSDAGDRARVVHIVEGSRTGWRMSYQYLADRGPFMRERIWETKNDEQPASIIPPLAHITDGPSGLAYYPGTGLDAGREGAFFVCDFLGASGRSGVREFHLERDGATYRLERDAMFAQGVLATDCDFGPDGNLYILDWLEGWTGTAKGRIYRLQSDSPEANAAREELTMKLAHMERADVPALIDLLKHADMRVRQAAQRRLIAAGDSAKQALLDATTSNATPLMARIHAIWALTRLAESDASVNGAFVLLCGDPDGEIRYQAARALGSARGANQQQPNAIGDALVKLLADPSTRVQSAAGIAIGKLAYAPALAALLTMADANADRDPVVRHAAVMGLAGSQPPEQLVAASAKAGDSARLAIVVALGRLQSPLIAEFLGDENERVALEAAREIWDNPIEAAYEKLSTLVDGRYTSEPLLRRSLAACLAGGAPAQLEAVVRCGLRDDVSPTIRELAWAAVSQWANPSPRDPVHGQWRPAPRRPEAQTVEVLRAMWPQIAAAASRDGTGIVVAAELGMPEAISLLSSIIESDASPAALRARAIASLEKADDDVVLSAVEAALASSTVEVRNAARRLLSRRFPERAIEALRAAADSATTAERQEAIQILATLALPAARETLAAWMSRVEDGSCPADLALDVLDAAAASSDSALVDRQDKFRQQQAAGGPLARFGMCVDGGDEVRGKLVYDANAAVACKRCHATKPGVVLVGPSLADVGAKRTRAELLESLVAPNAKIVEGFQTTSLMLDTGLAVAGIVRRENDTHVVLVDPEGKEQVVERVAIEERSQGLSAMPEDLVTHLTPREVRDLVAFLASLRDTTTPDAAAAAGHGE